MRTPNSQNHSYVHYSLSKFTGERFTIHSNRIHIFSPITRMVSTKRGRRRGCESATFIFMGAGIFWYVCQRSLDVHKSGLDKKTSQNCLQWGRSNLVDPAEWPKIRLLNRDLGKKFVKLSQENSKTQSSLNFNQSGPGNLLNRNFRDRPRPGEFWNFLRVCPRIVAGKSWHFPGTSLEKANKDTQNVVNLSFWWACRVVHLRSFCPCLPVMCECISCMCVCVCARMLCLLVMHVHTFPVCLLNTMNVCISCARL